MKFSLIFCIFISTISFAQIKPEIIEVKRLMSLGEKQGYKLTIYNQETKKVEKITKEVLKSLNSEQIKSQKSNRELIFKKLYIEKEDKPLYFFAEINQEGKNVGLFGYFIFEKDSLNCINTESINSLLKNIHNRVFFNEYEDSIYFQQKIVKEANSLLIDRTKETDKNQKKINQAKDDIHEAELSIEKSKSQILKLNESLPSFEKNIKEKENELKSSENNLDKTKMMENEIDDLNSKLKKMNKNLAILQKDPTTNEHLIIAQQQDIMTLSATIPEKEKLFKQAIEKSKSELKIAKKNYDNANEEQKSTKKSIKNEEDNIKDALNKIEKMKSKMNELYSSNDKFLSKDKAILEEDIKKQEMILNELKTKQSFYK